MLEDASAEGHQHPSYLGVRQISEGSISVTMSNRAAYVMDDGWSVPRNSSVYVCVCVWWDCFWPCPLCWMYHARCSASQVLPPRKIAFSTLASRHRDRKWKCRPKRSPYVCVFACDRISVVVLPGSGVIELEAHGKSRVCRVRAISSARYEQYLFYHYYGPFLRARVSERATRGSGWWWASIGA